LLIPLKSEEPTFKPPVITTLLIIANIAMFIYQQYSMIGYHRDIASMYGAIPYELTHLRDIPPRSPYPFFISIVTYMFLHGGVLHILGNMLFLNAFAPNIEDLMGHFKFLLFYLLCGIVAVVVYFIPNFNSQIPLVGASGAIAGVMGAHLRALPGTRIRCLFFIFPISLPAIIVLVPWILIQFANVMMHEQSNVAFIAHIGGFIFGLLTVKTFAKRSIYRKQATY
jgi:membrane associated rhomboid family serine protease